MSSALKPTQHYINDNDTIFTYREEKYLAEKLSNYLFENYTAQLRYDQSAHLRIEATDKIFHYGSTMNCVDLLSETVKIDENPNVRAAAREKLNLILYNNK